VGNPAEEAFHHRTFTFIASAGNRRQPLLGIPLPFIGGELADI